VSASRRWLLSAAVLFLALGALACQDAFFFAPAVDEPASVVLQWALQSGPGEAFDQADNVRVRLFPTGSQSTFLDQVEPFEPGPGESHVSLPVPLQDADASFGVEVEVRTGSAPLFHGNGQVSLRSGETTSVSVPLDPVGSALELPTPYPTLTAYGDILPLGGSVLFATGDPVPGLFPDWSTLDPNLVRLTQGTDDQWFAVALSDGTARLTATQGALSQNTTLEVHAEVVEVEVTPAETTIPEDSEVQLFAIPRDRNDNAIAGRTAEWTSLATSIVSVDAGGLARGETPGDAVVEAEVDGVVGSAQVTVVPRLPEATTLPAADVAAREVLLRGLVNPQGTETNVWFEFGTSPTLSQASTTASEPIGSGQTDVQVDAPVSGLIPDVTYYFRVVASAASGTVHGEILSFVTAKVPNAPSNLTVTVDGGVFVHWVDNSPDENGFEVERAVEPLQGPAQSALQNGDFHLIGTVGTNAREFIDSNPPPGLLTYRVRACASQGCSDYTPEVSVAYGAPPVVGTAPATQIGVSSALLQGTVDPRGSPTQAWFEIDDNPFLVTPLITPMTDVGQGQGIQSFTQFVGGLTPGATYYFSIRASNAGGTSSGAIQMFTTPRPPNAPSSVVLGYGGGGIDVTWKDNSGNETYFEIQREYAGAGAPGADGLGEAAVFLSVGTVPANTTFFNDPNPPSPAILNYRVRACNAVACSAYSLHASIFY